MPCNMDYHWIKLILNILILSWNTNYAGKFVFSVFANEKWFKSSMIWHLFCCQESASNNQSNVIHMYGQ